MVGLFIGCIVAGDGAGVGKGRQISGVILDNYVRGRRCAGRSGLLKLLSTSPLLADGHLLSCAASWCSSKIQRFGIAQYVAVICGGDRGPELWPSLSWSGSRMLGMVLSYKHVLFL